MPAFAISYSPVNSVVFRVLGLGPRRSGVEIDDAHVTVRMGWAFSSRFPRSAVRSAALDTGSIWEWGVHGWRGTWLVNGSSRGIVKLELEPPQRARTLVFRIRLRELRVSVERPDELVDELRPR
ncbi:MAG TPA: hypothetical protein VH572_12020 [Gaiella sp.]